VQNDIQQGAAIVLVIGILMNIEMPIRLQIHSGETKPRPLEPSIFYVTDEPRKVSCPGKHFFANSIALEGSIPGLLFII